MRIKMPAVRIAQVDKDQPNADTLLCGSCHKAFALADIVRFIQHKVLVCNKENYALSLTPAPEPSCPDDHSDDGSCHALGVVNARRPSISAPINAKKAPSRILCSPPSTSPKISEDDATTSTPKRRSGSTSPMDCKMTDENHLHCMDDELKPRIKQELDTGSSPDDVKKLRGVDAESNTTHSEPSNYVCSTCKARLHSAWRLVQHVQHVHGVRIYVETPGGSSSPGSSKNHSTSSSSSGCSSGGADKERDQSGNGVGGATNLAGAPLNSLPGTMRPSEPPLHSSFSVGGLLSSRPTSQHYPPTQASLFPRPSHDFRMDQLVSEQFRLNPHQLGLAAFAPPQSSLPSPSASSRATPIPPPPPLSLALEPQLDFYSQRLRQLAGTTSPGAATSVASNSPSPRKQMLTPPFASPPPPAPPNNNNNNSNVNNNNTSPPLASQPVALPGLMEVSDTTPRSTPGEEEKVRACEYCGKKFRFQSNLIVHRRTHTGEKPYKCVVCNHACTQSSKLKRHMKVHRGNGRAGGEAGAVNGGSASSTPDNTSNNSGSDNEDEEDEDEDEEEEEEEEMDLEEEEEELNDDDDDINGDAPEDLTTKSAPSTPGHSQGESKQGYSDQQNNKLDKKDPGKNQNSLVSELMDKFGLANIQQYNEAYKQALQESVTIHHIRVKDEFILHRNPLMGENNNMDKPLPKNVDKMRENGFEKNAAMRLREDFAKNLMTASHGGQAGHPLFRPGFDNPFDAASKRMKLDLAGLGGLGSLGGLGRGEYAGLWLPAIAAAHHRDMYPGNDDLLKTNPLLKTNGPKPGSSAQSLAVAAAAALNLNAGAPHLKKEASRRNDTCEYCGKIFKNCSNLTVHRRSHTGEKPYKCELCSYACAQSSKLTRHMKTHGRLGKDVYRCRFCEMPFSVPSTLEKHMRKCVVSQNKNGAHGLPMLNGTDDDSTSSATKDT